mmetsp:Transcript_22457/g.34634  ORF Transcript_22457/g.34634 Transcript_22457/m.34634 type:complete len:335 (+) Transcript_22457:46-1050(+)
MPHIRNLLLLVSLSFCIVTNCLKTNDYNQQRIHVISSGINTRGGGIFSKAAQIADEKSAELTNKAKQAAVGLDEATDRIKEVAKQRAKQELKDLQVEAKKKAVEAELAAKRTAIEIEKLAKLKALEAESIAKTTASNVEKAARDKAIRAAEQLEKAAYKRAAEYEKAFNKKAQEVERLTKQKAANLEKGVMNLLDRVSAPVRQKEKEVKKKIAHTVFFLTVVIAVVCTVSLSGIFNIIGFPEGLLLHWDEFGDKFFPFDMDIDKKRILAGVMELSGVALIFKRGKARKLGAGLVSAMYSWATIINSQLYEEMWKPIVSGIIAFLACFILVNSTV